MIIKDYVLDVANKWGMRKTMTIIFTNLSVMGIVSLVLINTIPDHPDEISETIKEKESK